MYTDRLISSRPQPWLYLPQYWKYTPWKRGWGSQQEWRRDVPSGWQMSEMRGGKILVTVLTVSESTRSLQPMVNGRVKRFERSQRKTSLLLHLDRAHILFMKGCHFWFTTFLVLFVLEPLVQVWVRFSFIVYTSLFFPLGVFLHIVYPALLVIFTSVLCLIHLVSLSLP